MQLVSSSSSSSSSASTSSHSSGDHHGEPRAMEKFERMHLHSPSPPPLHHLKGQKPRPHRHHSPPPAHHHHQSPSLPPPSHFKGKKHHHHCRNSSSPPPAHHDRHHFVSKHRHYSPPLLNSFHCEKGKLRVKPPKPSKKVRKLHHKLMKACKLPKGGGAHHHHHLPLAPEAIFFGADAVFEHPPGCCLHYHGMHMEDERLAEERRPPHEMGVGYHGFRVHHRPHKQHPHPHQSAVAPMLPGDVAAAMPNEPHIEVGASPPSATPATLQQS